MGLFMNNDLVKINYFNIEDFLFLIKVELEPVFGISNSNLI